MGAEKEMKEKQIQSSHQKAHLYRGIAAAQASGLGVIQESIRWHPGGNGHLKEENTSPAESNSF